MIKKRAERVRDYRKQLKPRPQHEKQRPLKSELLKREIAELDARIEAERAAEVAAEEGRPVNVLVKGRNLAARELRQALVEEHLAELKKQAEEAREHAVELEKQAVKVDHALQGFLREYLSLKDDIEHARRKGWMPWTTATTAVCDRALKTALQPIPEFGVRPLGYTERKCFSEIGLSFGDAVRGAAVRLGRDPYPHQAVKPEPAQLTEEKTKKKRIDPQELGVTVYDNREAADAADRAAMAGTGGKP